MRFYAIPFTSFIYFISICFTAGCSSTPIENESSWNLSKTQINRMENIAELSQIHQALQKNLIDKDPYKFEQQYATLSEVQARLTSLYQYEINQKLQYARSQNDPIPLPTLKSIREQYHSDQNLSSDIFSIIMMPILQEENITESAIHLRKNKVKNSDLSAEDRVILYKELFDLTGDTQWQEVRKKQIHIIIDALKSASNKNIFNQPFEKKLDFLTSSYQDAPSHTKEELNTLYASFYTSQFFKAQSDNNPDAAFSVLNGIKQKTNHDEITNKLKPISEKILSDFHQNVSDEIKYSNRLSSAFRRLIQYEELGKILGSTEKKHPLKGELTNRVLQLYHLLKQKNEMHAALGVLYALQTLDAEQESLGDWITETQDKIEQTRISTLRITDFHFPANQADYTTMIRTSLHEQLSRLLLDSITLIPTEETDFASADTFVTGNILKSEVEFNQSKEKKQITITIGQNQLANPEYLTWLSLPIKEQQKQEKPPEILLKDQHQTIFLTRTVHRKTATMAISYRLMDSLTNSTIFADTITLQTQHEDDSHEGIEVGNVNIPYKSANLPEDAILLEQLIKDIAESIASNLAAVLQNQEEEFLKMAEKFSMMDNCQLEVKNLAKFLTLSERKNTEPAIKKNNKPRDRLIEKSLQCF